MNTLLYILGMIIGLVVFAALCGLVGILCARVDKQKGFVVGFCCGLVVPFVMGTIISALPNDIRLYAYMGFFAFAGVCVGLRSAFIRGWDKLGSALIGGFIGIVVSGVLMCIAD